jgi:hypothetical protein
MAAPFSPEPAPASVEATRPRAWQPFTPKGIAVFAPASFGRLFAFQVLVALLSGGVVVWFLWTVWFPIARESIQNLAGDGAIRAGSLELPGFGMQRLATNRFLTLAIDVDSDRRHDYSADVFMVLRRSHVDVCSLFGCAARPYPVREAAFTRLELEAQWGAWQPFLLGIAGITVAFAVLFLWWLLATLYFLFARLLAFFQDRALTLGGSWRLCSAALLAGTVFLLLAVVGYGLSVVNFIPLLLLAALHMLIPWVLIVFAVLALPRAVPKPANPFTAEPGAAEGTSAPPPPPNAQG